MSQSKYLLLVFILSLGLCHKGHSHKHHSAKSGSIKGRVIDEGSKHPRKYANVSIKKDGTNKVITGGVTDDDGYFLLDKVPFGKYYVVVSYIGFEEKTRPGIDLSPPNNIKINLGNIEIRSKTIAVESIEVKEKAATVLEDIEKTTYIVEDLAYLDGESAKDILEKLPSVTIDMDGKLNLRGNPNVTIMIDGRESKLNLEILNSSMIEKVEIMTTPSAKYDPQGMAGIINIVLSKNKFVGSSGSVALSNNIFNRKVLVGDKINQDGAFSNGGQNIAVSFNYFKNNLNIFTTYGLNLKKEQATEDRRIIFTDSNQESYESLNNSGITNSHPFINNLKLGIERYFTIKSLLAFDMTYLDHTITDTTSLEGTNPLQTITDKQGHDLNYGIGYFYEDKEANKNFSIEFDYDDHNESYTSTYDLLTDEIIDIGIDKIFSVNYSSPLSLNEQDSKYEAGLKVLHEDDMHGGQVMDENFDWMYENLVTAGYFTFDYIFSNHLSIKAGARFEKQSKKTTIEYNQDYNCDDIIGTSSTSGFCNCIEYDNDGKCLEFEDSLFKNLLTNLGDNLSYKYTHNRFYPSLFLFYKTHSDAIYKLSLSRRIERPSHHEVNPIPDLTEISNNWIEQGNPYLDPEDIYISELTYSDKTPFGFIKTSLYANKVYNLIDRDIEAYNNELTDEAYIKFTSKNIAESFGKGLEVYYSASPTSNWDFIFNGNYWHNKFRGLDLVQNNIESGFWGMANSTFRLSGNQEIGIYSHFSSPLKITSGTIEPSMRIDLSYKNIISDNLIFKIKIKDIFDNSSFNVNTESYINIDSDSDNHKLQKMRYIGRPSQQTFSISLEYRFGALQRKKYIRDDSDYQENNNEYLEEF